jgi:hypothetical protein
MRNVRFLPVFFAALPIPLLASLCIGFSLYVPTAMLGKGTATRADFVLFVTSSGSLSFSYICLSFPLVPPHSHHLHTPLNPPLNSNQPIPLRAAQPLPAFERNNTIPKMPSKIQLDENLWFLYICLQKSDLKSVSPIPSPHPQPNPANATQDRLLGRRPRNKPQAARRTNALHTPAPPHRIRDSDRHPRYPFSLLIFP